MQKKIKAYTHIYKIVAMSLLNEDDGVDSEGLEVVVMIRNSNFLDKNSLHTMDFKRKFLEDNKITLGSVMKVIIYSKNESPAFTNEEIRIDSCGYRIEKLDDETKSWNRISESME